MSRNRNLFVREWVGDNFLRLRPWPVWVGAAAELSQLVVGAHCQLSIFSQSSRTAELQRAQASVLWPWEDRRFFMQKGKRHQRDVIFSQSLFQQQARAF